MTDCDHDPAIVERRASCRHTVAARCDGSDACGRAQIALVGCVTMPGKFTEELITRHLETLSHGGQQAIALFLELSKQIHQHGAEDGLQDWVTIAAPALPEKERNEVLVMLMCSHLYLDSQAPADAPEGSAPTVH